MISFFIDTCTSFVTIALLKDNKLINQKNIVSNRDLSNNLFEYIEQLFKEVAILPKDVKRIYVSIGPGSFTGVRIGLTIAKTYAYSLDIKLVPISSLEIMSSTLEGDSISIIDARRGYVYAGLYDSNGNNGGQSSTKRYNMVDRFVKLAFSSYLTACEERFIVYIKCISQILGESPKEMK